MALWGVVQYMALTTPIEITLFCFAFSTHCWAWGRGSKIVESMVKEGRIIQAPPFTCSQPEKSCVQNRVTFHNPLLVDRVYQYVWFAARLLTLVPVGLFTGLPFLGWFLA
jgi:hypothetical protein